MRTRSRDGRSLSASDGPASPTSPSSSSSLSSSVGAATAAAAAASSTSNRHGESFKTKRKEPKSHPTVEDSGGGVSARSSVDIAPPLPEKSPRRISSSSSSYIATASNNNHHHHHHKATWASPPSSITTTAATTSLKEDSSTLRPAQPPAVTAASERLGSLAGLHKSTIMAPPFRGRNRLRSPWACSFLILVTALLAAALSLLILTSYTTRQLDPKGCAMSFMRPAFAKFSDFDTEHTRFASKYSLYLYREGGVDEDTRVKGTPVLFIPGNAGSYKQVRPLAAEAAVYFHDHLSNDPAAINSGKRPLDFFSVDFNEDITAFHGQTMLDQAEYLNEAVAYILSLYHNPNRSLRDPDLPDPTSVVIVGHSMGGVVARTMLTLPNYQANSINTIVTLAAPHARAPVSFDSDIVRTYQRINDYWRTSYSQKWANDNPLWHVTLVSIAGGGLDNVVPSDYSTIASLVPPSHGFTVFTSTIPNVWSGMDHLCITWCDQLRIVLVRALFDVVDAGRSSQTLPRIDRMRAFKRHLLTGLEDVAETSISLSEPQTLLTLEHDSNSIISQGERLVLRQLGETGRRRAYLLPIPPYDSAEPKKKFSLLTNQKLGRPGSDEMLEVMFCSIYPPNDGQSSTVFSTSIDLSTDGTGSTKLACKNAANDVATLPASTSDSQYPFDKTPPFSYIQYDLEHLADQQFVAVVDKSTQRTSGWVLAEFFAAAETTETWSRWTLRPSLRNSSLTVALGPASAERPMLTEFKAPSIYSALLAYRLKIDAKHQGEQPALFPPLVRQSIAEPYESKFFVNVKEADINMHGLAPYVPPPLKANRQKHGLSLQIWSDPTSTGDIVFTLELDLLGSMGKLWMRYRTLFATLPVMVVALVLRKQFMHYDESGIFMSFAEGLDQCLRRSIPLLILALTVMGVSTGSSTAAASSGSSSWFSFWRSRNATATAAAAAEGLVDFAQKDLLMGSPDPFFWFLLPTFGIISVGVCIAVNYFVLGLSQLLAFVYGRTRKHLHGRTERKRSNSVAVTPFRRRLVITVILLVLVSTVIPYQFVYVVLCIVQLSTCVRLLSFARDTYATTSLDFYNYAHSIFILMLWMLPVNLPILVVWSRNLAVHWLTPFSSHHNILSITPFVLLVETLGTGKMIPRSYSWIPRQFTSWLFMLLACYAAVYGATYAYLLHSLVNAACAWLVTVHISGLGIDWRRSLSVFFDNVALFSNHSPRPSMTSRGGPTSSSSQGYFFGAKPTNNNNNNHSSHNHGHAPGHGHVLEKKAATGTATTTTTAVAATQPASSSYPSSTASNSASASVSALTVNAQQLLSGGSAVAGDLYSDCKKTP